MFFLSISVALRVYNTLSRKVEAFEPISAGIVKVYICGLTVYDFMHIGHARTYIAFDAILRYLKFCGYRVDYVQNITDVDDKIIKRAMERGVSPLNLSRDYAEKSIEDQKRLGLIKPLKYPRVSESIDDIISAVVKLVGAGNAYEAGGSIYFDVSKSKGYGRLSNQDTEQLSQHRIEPTPDKRNPLDFALWKRVDDGFGFESPWGLGRPGWHIECTAMSQRHLGDQIDIHGGALDLIFPHHENETAQSEALTGKTPFVKYWLHTGFLNSSGEKMSKSLGNILSVRKLLEECEADAFRLFILQTHYRSPIDFSTENLENSKKALERLRNLRQRLQEVDGISNLGDLDVVFSDLRKEYVEAMDDDFQTSKALAALFEAAKKANQILDLGRCGRDSAKRAVDVLDELSGVFGLNLAGAEHIIPEHVMLLVVERNACRVARDFAKADSLRDAVFRLGYAIKDGKDGSTTVEPLK